MIKNNEKDNNINDFSQIEQASLYNEIKNASKSSSGRNREKNNKNKIFQNDIDNQLNTNNS